MTLVVPPLENLFREALPGDAAGPPTASRQVHGAHWSNATPTPVRAPRLALWVPEVARLLGWPEDPDPATREALAAALSGNQLLPGSRPIAVAYGGHQFGQWAGQLGDGRAMLLGEVVNEGRRYEVQLKGAGRTPYSRHADGRAVLRSSIRELVCSEAMHHLGVPTTRALALVTTGDEVVRDMFYDGRPRPEPGAIVTRVAPTFVRLGNFELFASRDDVANVERLLDWVIRVHHPELTGEAGAATVDGATRTTTPAQRAAFFTTLCERTADMVARWMSLGFVHGVMNTDNLSVLGLTIDYGPYGWLDHYDPEFTPNTTDAVGRRYAYGRQAGVALWNLARLGDALALVVPVPELERGLSRYREVVQATWARLMADKLGLEIPDEVLVGELLLLMAEVETDWTILFRKLTDVPAEGAGGLAAHLAAAFYRPLTSVQAERWEAWLQRLSAHWRGRDVALRVSRMRGASPWFIPRNYLVFQGIAQAAAGDFSPVEALLAAARRPYDEDALVPELFARRPEWAREQPGASALSCSS